MTAGGNTLTITLCSGLRQETAGKKRAITDDTEESAQSVNYT